MNAITMLTDDHRTVKKLLSELESTTERGVKTREELFTRIKADLTVHEIIEEEIFYPALKEHPKAKDIVLEGYEEHNVVDTLMGELSALPFDDETVGRQGQGDAGEHRAPHRRGRGRDVQEGSPGLRRGGARGAR